MDVLLADNHPLILWAFQAMLEEIQPGVSVTSVSTPAAVREAVAAQPSRFGLLLLDLQLGDPASGYELLADLRMQHPELPVVVVSATNHPADVIHAIDLGASGYLPKRLSTTALADALRLVLEGGIFVPPMGPSESTAAVPASAGPETYQTLPSFEALGLTPRQADVLGLLLQGKPNKEIARRLGLSVETVKDHVQAVLRALGVNSRTQAVLAVNQLAVGRRMGPMTVGVGGSR